MTSQAVPTIHNMHLEVTRLSKRYPGNRGLSPTSFTVRPGELVALVGPNGAGKSTLLKLLANWLVPDSGHVTIQGVELRDRLTMVRKVGFVPETPNLHEAFSVNYNWFLFARLFGVPASRVDDTLETLKLHPYRHSTVRTLSKGLKQRVNIGRSLIADPPVLLLDEPTAALDFEAMEDIHRLFHQVQARGTTILFSSHRPEEIKALATRILALHNGMLVFDGDPEAFFQSSCHRTVGP